eukprot:6172344-Pleurochrysis_carterae.AAC.4
MSRCDLLESTPRVWSYLLLDVKASKLLVDTIYPKCIQHVGKLCHKARHVYELCLERHCSSALHAGEGTRLDESEFAALAERSRRSASLKHLCFKGGESWRRKA